MFSSRNWDVFTQTLLNPHVFDSATATNYRPKPFDFEMFVELDILGFSSPYLEILLKHQPLKPVLIPGSSEIDIWSRPFAVTSWESQHQFWRT